MTSRFNRVESIYRRRSVRSFKQKSIPKSMLYEIIRAGTMSPASGNMQPWEFIVIDNEETKKRVVEQTFSGFYSNESNQQEWIKSAGVILVACTNFKRTVARYGSLAYKWAPLDTASAVQNILLTSSELGLASCWVGGFREDELKKLLHIPSYVKPIGLIPIGYSNQKTEPKQKLRAEWVTHHNCYNSPFFKI